MVRLYCQGHKRKGMVMCFIDDIIIATETTQDSRKTNIEGKKPAGVNCELKICDFMGRMLIV